MREPRHKLFWRCGVCAVSHDHRLWCNFFYCNHTSPFPHYTTLHHHQPQRLHKKWESLPKKIFFREYGYCSVSHLIFNLPIFPFWSRLFYIVYFLYKMQAFKIHFISRRYPISVSEKKIEEKKSKVAWNGKRVEECIAVHLSSLLTWCTAKGDTFFNITVYKSLFLFQMVKGRFFWRNSTILVYLPSFSYPLHLQNFSCVVYTIKMKYSSSSLFKKLDNQKTIHFLEQHTEKYSFKYAVW